MATKFITVTIETMHDKNLSPNQKFILSEISQLSSLEKGCIASNRHFSELIGITMSGVSKAISDLVEKKYISIDNSQTKRNFGRIITIDSVQEGIDSGKSSIDSVQETKENITKNNFMLFVEHLRDKVNTKSKVTVTKDTKKLFEAIENKHQLAVDYINHQREKKEFAQRLTPFLLDYKPCSIKPKQTTMYNGKEVEEIIQ